MRIVKHLWNMDGHYTLFGMPFNTLGSWSLTNNSFSNEENLYKDHSSNSLEFTKGTISPTELKFDDDSLVYTVSFQILEDLIPYTECYVGRLITDCNLITPGFYSLTHKILIKLIFDGPDELALQWKLSI